MESSMADRRVNPSLVKYDPSELKTASEFLSTWLPFLSADLCPTCTDLLSLRIRSLESQLEGNSGVVNPGESLKASESQEEDYNADNLDYNSMSDNDVADTNSLGSWKDGNSASPEAAKITLGTRGSARTETASPRKSWADMAQEDELEGGEDEEPASSKRVVDVNAWTQKLRISSEVVAKPKLSTDQREYLRFKNVKREKDFKCFERFKGKYVNILEGLELHEGIFSAVEQKRIVDYVYELEKKGRRGELKERTFTAPTKWMKGKGRITIQFGCCYNYATDRKGNPPGILHNELVDPLPDLFKVIIRRLVKWHVLPPTCVPDSCIVNIYEEGDCIPPHIDNHDFVRPFCTVSFLSQCDIIFGLNLKILGPGEFSGSYSIPLPVGSVLVLNGNGADIAKHSVPAVPTKRISITFRKMDESKRPAGFTLEPDLQGIQPLPYREENANRPSEMRESSELREPRSDQQHSRRPASEPREPRSDQRHSRRPSHRRGNGGSSSPYREENVNRPSEMREPRSDQWHSRRPSHRRGNGGSSSRVEPYFEPRHSSQGTGNWHRF